MKKFSPTYRRTRLPKSELVQKIRQNPRVAIRELNNRSFYRFLKFMWPAVSSEKFIDNWHIKLVCDELQALAERVVVERNRQGRKQPLPDMVLNVPPGTTKTTIVMILFPAWCWTRWYWMEFIGVSYAAGLSLESAEDCRDLIKSDRFRSIYPDLEIRTDKDQKSNFQLLKTFEKRPGYSASTKHGGARYSTSVGGTVTGFHGHIVLVDDPINPEQAVSPKQLETANRWIDQTLSQRKIHKESSPTVTIMQRLHENDPSGHKLEKDEDIIHICLPGEIENYEDQVKPAELKEFYSEEGLLDPIRLNWNVLKKMKSDLGQYGYAGQVGQSPTPPTGGMFEVDRIAVVERPPPVLEIEQVVRYWDKAGTEENKKRKGKGPAWSVGVKMGKLTNGKFVILNVKRGRWSSGEREKIIKATAEADGVQVTVGIEQEPGSGGKESAEATVKNLAGYDVFVDRPTGNKETRADPYSVQVEYGNVLMVQADWNKAYKEELRFFPNSTFKDQVDASSGAFAMLTSKKKARVMS